LKVRALESQEQSLTLYKQRWLFVVCWNFTLFYKKSDLIEYLVFYFVPILSTLFIRREVALLKRENEGIERVHAAELEKEQVGYYFPRGLVRF
jgi:hypothetical protein